MRRTERFAKLVKEDPDEAIRMMMTGPIWQTPKLVVAALSAMDRRIKRLERMAKQGKA